MKLLKIQSTGDFINLDLVTYVKTIATHGNDIECIEIHFSGGSRMSLEYSKPSKELYDRLTNLCEVVV